jgi:hypothetical protein
MDKFNIVHIMASNKNPIMKKKIKVKKSKFAMHVSMRQLLPQLPI